MALKTPDIITGDISLMGKNKVNTPFMKTFVLSILAGIYISIGGILMISATQQPIGSFGVTKLLGGFVFSIGLILVILAGAELFTGNSLMVIGFHDGHLKLKKMLLNWSIVYVGNFVGSALAVGFIYLSGIWQMNNGLIGLNAVNIAAAKTSLNFSQAFVRGIGGNLLVCLAVWLATSGDNTTDKIAGILFPITAFVALGFEHSIANMFLIPIGLSLKAFYQGSWPTLNMIGFLNNLIPVTIGNIVGGTAVGYVYWFVYKKNKTKLQPLRSNKMNKAA